MSTLGTTARFRVAVMCLCAAATASLVSLGASLFSVNGVFFDNNVILTPVINPTHLHKLLLIMAVAGAAGAITGLIVIHRARRTGWPILLLAGTVLTAAHLAPVLGLQDPLRGNGSEVVFAAMGAGSVLALLGLLGAANWLIHAGARGSGCVIAGLALVAPVLSSVALSVFWVVEDADAVALRWLGLVLCSIGTAGAIGATALIPVLRGLPEQQAPPAMVTVLGGIAASVQVVPILVLRAYEQPLAPGPDVDPDNPYDDLYLLLGMTGLIIFMAGIGLAAGLGSRSLGAAMAIGLVLYAVQIPLWLAIRSVDSRGGTAIVAALALIVAGVFAASRWRAWIAGGACALVGVVIVAMRPGFVDAPMSAWLGACLLLLVVVAVVTTVAAGAAATAERTRLPVVLGIVATTIQLGLVYSGVLVFHSGIAGDRSELVIDPLTIGSGVALLVGALLVVLLPFIRTPAPAPDPPDMPDVPNVPPSGQGVPVAR